MNCHGRLFVLGLLMGCASCAPKPENRGATHWANFPVGIYADQALVSDQALENDFKIAMSFWEDRAGTKLFSYMGTWGRGRPFTGNPTRVDAILGNVIFFQNPWPFEARALGETTVRSTNAEIQGAIIMINPGSSICVGSCQFDLSRSGARKLFAHELGHFLGLEHAQSPDNIMYPMLSPGGDLAKAQVDMGALEQITP